MSFVMDLVQSSRNAPEDLEFNSWPASFQPSEHDKDNNYEQYMDLACSVSGSCPADFAKGELNTAFSLDSEPSGQEAARSRSNDLGMSEPSNKRLSAAERKLQSNRQAQKRFRQRQKVRLSVRCMRARICYELHVARSSWLTAVPQERSHTAEAKLLETTAQLEELQVRQRQLEARNLLLEKVARLNKQTVLREAHEPVPLPWEVSP